MANELRDYTGGAVATTLSAGINSTDLSISIDDATGWPSGGANGPFFVVVDYDLATPEKIEVQSRTGTTLTVANTGKRGVDGTSAGSHLIGASIRHCITAQDFNEFNSHAFDTTLDQHTQYHNTARHAAVSHTQAMLAADSVGAAQIQANAVGSSELADNAVDTNAIANLAVTAAKIATDTITATQIAADAIGTSELAADAVGASELANSSVAQANLVSPLAAVYVAATASDPGAVGNGKIWFDTTTRQIKVRNAADSGWDIYAEKITPWTDYVPTLVGVTLGSGAGAVYGRYTRLGKTVVGIAGFRLGTGGNVTAGVSLSLPSTAAFVGANMVGNAEWLAGGRASQVAGTRFAGIGRTTSGAPTTIVQVATGGAGGWDATYPFNWDDGDLAALFFMYEEV